jgi:hypothetical protein
MVLEMLVKGVEPEKEPMFELEDYYSGLDCL